MRQSRRRIIMLLAVLWGLLHPWAAEAFHEETVLLPLRQGVLEGTWTEPDSSGPWPAALLIQGSGPTDRDGNGPGGAGAGEMALLARGLAERGVAVLRFDKGGTGRSAVIQREEDLCWQDGTDQAVRWAALIRQKKEVSALFLIGHSEGALTAMEAAPRVMPDGMVLLASPGFPAGTLLRKQLIDRFPWLYEKGSAALGQLERGETADPRDDRLDFLLRPSVQPFLKGLLSADPQQDMRALPCAVLILQGDRDSQVGTENGKALKEAAPEGELRIIRGMNHVLKTAPPDRESQEMSYESALLPLSPGMADMTAEWILRLAREKGKV